MPAEHGWKIKIVRPLVSMSVSLLPLSPPFGPRTAQLCVVGDLCFRGQPPHTAGSSPTPRVPSWVVRVWGIPVLVLAAPQIFTKRFKKGVWDITAVVDSGGMPSSHSSLCSVSRQSLGSRVAGTRGPGAGPAASHGPCLLRSGCPPLPWCSADLAQPGVWTCAGGGIHSRVAVREGRLDWAWLLGVAPHCSTSGRCGTTRCCPLHRPRSPPTPTLHLLTSTLTSHDPCMFCPYLCGAALRCATGRDDGHRTPGGPGQPPFRHLPVLQRYCHV